MLDQGALVLEGVTLAELVEFVVKVLVDLASGTVLDEKASKDTETSHPENLAVCLYQQKLLLSVPLSVLELSYLGILASLVPFLLPNPRCRPILRAAFSSLARARECMATGLRMIRPSLTSFRIVWREFALAISEASLGSSHTRRSPQPSTVAARRF